MQTTVECLIPVMQATLCVKPSPYESILELEKTIRTYVNPGPEDLTDGTAISMRVFVRQHYGDLSEFCTNSWMLAGCWLSRYFAVLMYLHRSFFVKALYEDDPYSSPYARSIESAYVAAIGVLKSTKNQLEKQPLLCPRIWQIWSFAFSAAVKFLYLMQKECIAHDHAVLGYRGNGSYSTKHITIEPTTDSSAQDILRNLPCCG